MRELEEAITRKRSEVERLRASVAMLPQAEADLTALLRAQQILAGGEAPRLETPPAADKGTTLADKIATVLPHEGGMHVHQIIERLAQRGSVVSKGNVVNTILRNAGKRFTRTGPNTFALIREDLHKTPYRSGELPLTQ
jgi:hypothetical protein